MTDRFQLAAPYQPAGDQPQAIAHLAEGFEAGLAAQTLLGVTGSGKTYTIANVIERVQRPTIVMAATKTLLSRRDSIIVATVSAIYGLGNPEDYLSLRLILATGERIDQRKLIHQLTELQYTRNET